MVYYWETQLFRGHWSPGDFWDPSRCRCWGCCWKLKLLTAAPWLTTVRWKMPATWIRWVFVKWRVFVKGLKQEESEMQPPSRLTICWLVYMGLYMFIYVYIVVACCQGHPKILVRICTDHSGWLDSTVALFCKGGVAADDIGALNGMKTWQNVTCMVFHGVFDFVGTHTVRYDLFESIRIDYLEISGL